MAGKKSEVTVTAMELRRNFGEIIDAVIASRPHIVTRHNRPIAVLISVEDYELLKRAKESA